MSALPGFETRSSVFRDESVPIIAQRQITTVTYSEGCGQDFRGKLN